MKQKIYFPLAIAFVIVCAILLVVVILQYSRFFNKLSEQPSNNSPEEEVEKENLCKDKNGEEKDDCFSDTAKKNRDSNLCEEIENQGREEACYEWVEFLLAYDEAEKRHIKYEMEPISDWKTFKDGEFGFEIKYPSDFTLIKYDDKIDFSFPEVNFQDTALFLDQSGVFIYKNEKGYNCSSIQQFEDWGYEKITTSNGDIFYKDNWRGGGCGSGRCESETSYYTIHNDYCYIVKLKMSHSSYSSPEFGAAWGRVPFDSEELKETYNQMFSTFKFLELVSEELDKAILEEAKKSAFEWGYPDPDDQILSSSYSYEAVDLNGDGVNEFIIKIKYVNDYFTRGASDNGQFLIFQKINNSWEKIGDMIGKLWNVKEEKTNGYYNISTYWHYGAGEGECYLYKWDELKTVYIESTCI